MECNNCSKKYSTRRSLIRHIQTSHAGEINGVRSYKKIKTHECYSCGTTFSTRRSLIRHWRHFHSSLISTTPEDKIWDCHECVKQYTNKFSWYKHKRMCHPNSKEFVERKLKKIFECDNCGKKYSVKRSLCRHLKSSHPLEMTANMSDKSIDCSTYGKRWCPDAKQRGGMCGHIHSVCQFRKRSLPDGYERMLVEEIIVE